MPESNTQINKPLDNDDEPEPPPSIEIANQQSLPVDESRLRQAITQILNDGNWHNATISLAIVDDPTIHQLNAQFLEHDYETDVLSFVFDRDESSGLLEGEVIVSADTAHRLAQEYGIPYQDELLLYVIHGTLHLVGMDDKNEAACEKMRSAEQEYMQQSGAEYRKPAKDDESQAPGESP